MHGEAGSRMERTYADLHSMMGDLADDDRDSRFIAPTNMFGPNYHFKI